MAVVALVSTGCDTSRTPEGSTGDKWLSELIRLAPVDYEPGWLYFANQKKMRDIAGANDFNGFPGMLHGSENGDVYTPAPWTYEAMFPMDSVIRDSSHVMYNLTGVDIFFVDEILSVEAFDHDTPTFMVIKGSSVDGEQLPGIIEELGYHKRSDGELTYYQWFADDENRSRDRSREYPFGRPPRIVALSVLDNRLFISKKPAFLLKSLGVHQGDSPSLFDEKSYRELADAVAPEVVSGVFLRPDFVIQGWAEYGRKYSKTLDRYTTGENPWGIMEPYTAAILGMGVGEGELYMVVGLHFSDADAADRNIDELRYRLSTTQVMLSVDASSYDIDDPFTAFCAPLDYKTVVLRDASVIIVTCPISDYAPSSHPGFPTSAFVWVLVLAHELHFLIPDLNSPVLQ